MKSFIRLLTIISVSFSGTLLKGNGKQILLDSDSEKAAWILADLASKRPDVKVVEDYLTLIGSSEVMSRANKGLKLRDFAIAAIEQQTKIKPTRKSGALKVILSCYKNGKRYNYHIPELSSGEIRVFYGKVQNWIKSKKKKKK